MVQTRVLSGLILAAALVGCAHPSAVMPAVAPAAKTAAPAARTSANSEADRPYATPIQTYAHVDISDGRNETIKPEDVEPKARALAAKWQPDAELRFVGWGVAMLEFASECNHVFYSPSKNQLLVVTTFLTEKWQRADAYDNPYVADPAKLLQPLAPSYHVDAHEALDLAKQYFSLLDQHPISLSFLTRPIKLPFAFWGIVADKTVVLVHADTGQSLSPRGFDPFPKEWTKK